MGSTLHSSQMRREIDEIPQAVERLLSSGQASIRHAADRARQRNPAYLLSIARGSSDCACSYLKYACELILRRPMASLGPSVKSIYQTDLQCHGALGISVSQSGTSPDIVQMTQSIAAGGAFTIAITNNTKSALAAAACATLPLHAGTEYSVAATKTFVTSVVAGLWLIAEIDQHTALISAIHNLPEKLQAASTCDWSALAEAIGERSLYTIGRGPSLAIATEAALKFKETCQIHAQSYSSAEVMHGPVSIVEAGFPVVAFAAGDAAEHSIASACDTLANKGARVFATTDKVSSASALPHIRTGHGLTDPLAAIVSFYRLADTLAHSRGIDPDTPRHLKKVTETL